MKRFSMILVALYVPGCPLSLMGGGERTFGRGRVAFQAMLSLEGVAADVVGSPTLGPTPGISRRADA
jgi:hypothetical protein